MSESFGWEKGSIENSIPYEGRSLNEHEQMLNLPMKNLEGQVVLELGSALGARFAKDLQIAGIKATVISVSPDFAEEKYREEIRPSLGDKTKAAMRLRRVETPLAVAAVGEKLPFPDETFDRVIALYSTSRYAKEHEQWIKEVCRVLKEGGELRAGPFPFGKFYRGMGENFVARFIKFLDDLGYEYEFTDTPGFEKTKRGDDDEEEVSLLILKKQKRAE